MRQYLSRRDILGQSLHRSPIQQTTSILKVVKTTSGLKRQVCHSLMERVAIAL